MNRILFCFAFLAFSPGRLLAQTVDLVCIDQDKDEFAVLFDDADRTRLVMTQIGIKREYPGYVKTEPGKATRMEKPQISDAIIRWCWVLEPQGRYRCLAIDRRSGEFKSIVAPGDYYSRYGQCVPRMTLKQERKF